MIRSVPNPPMGKEDVVRFRKDLIKHFRDSYNKEERALLKKHRAQSEATAKRIIDNCGGKNPLLGY